MRRETFDALVWASSIAMVLGFFAAAACATFRDPVGPEPCSTYCPESYGQCTGGVCEPHGSMRLHDAGIYKITSIEAGE